MTDNDIRLAVISANNTLATNNPKGLTEALKNSGEPVDDRFDILSYDALSKALLDLYASNPNKWARIMESVPFNYEKTDSSTTQNTKTLFENITKSFNPSDTSSMQKSDKPKWWETALGFIIGGTTTTHTAPVSTSDIKSRISPWVYVAYAVLGLSILGIVFIMVRQKNV